MIFGAVMTVSIIAVFDVIAWVQQESFLVILYTTITTLVAGSIGIAISWVVLKKLYLSYSGGNTRPKYPSVQMQSGEEFEVGYKLDFNDVMAFYSFHFEQSPQLGRTRRLLRRVLLLVLSTQLVGIITILLAFGTQYKLIILALGALSALTILYYIASPALSRMVLRREVMAKYGQRENELTGKHEVKVTPNAVFDFTFLGESRTPWDAIDYVATTDQYLFLFVRGANPHIIPRRAFADEATFRQFSEVAKAYHYTAGPQRQS
ncbi:MAG: YcxB family protein [Dehalococcoidales bacterium]|nr:YcxB family protein [Dehalococcoidales bacterium]